MRTRPPNQRIQLTKAFLRRVCLSGVWRAEVVFASAPWTAIHRFAGTLFGKRNRGADQGLLVQMETARLLEARAFWRGLGTVPILQHDRPRQGSAPARGEEGLRSLAAIVTGTRSITGACTLRRPRTCQAVDCKRGQFGRRVRSAIR